MEATSAKTAEDKISVLLEKDNLEDMMVAFPSETKSAIWKLRELIRMGPQEDQDGLILFVLSIAYSVGLSDGLEVPRERIDQERAQWQL